MALDDDVAALAAAPLLGLLPPEALRLVCFAAARRPLRADEVLFRAGEHTDGGYVVLSGRVRVEPPPSPREAAHEATHEAARQGARERAPLVVGAGAVLGRVALFLRQRRSSTATAEVPTEVMRIPPALMRRVLEEFPAAAEAVRDALARDLAVLNRDLGRVGADLAALDDPAGRGGAVPGPPGPPGGG